MNRTEIVDYLAKNLHLSHVEAEMAANSALRDSARRRELNAYRISSLDPNLEDFFGQQRRNKTMSDFKLKAASL